MSGSSSKISSRAVGTRKWIWGDKRMGYSTVFRGPMAKSPFTVETWLRNVRVRTDDFPTAAEAEKYANQRQRAHYGNKTPARARRDYL